MVRVNGTATNMKIIALFNKIKDNSLELKPSFQRKLVWNDSHKEAFILTILFGLPFPEIYLADGEIDLQKQTSKTLVVDGQQRLSTIFQYISESDKFKIKNIPKFSELSKDEQTLFFDYIVVVRDLGRIDDISLKEIFKRINSVQYALNAMEIQNALYEGEFISCAKDILETSCFKDFEIFSEAEFSRMVDWEYILLIMATYENKNYFPGFKGIEEFVVRYENEYTNKEEIKSNLSECFIIIKRLNINFDSIWFRKSTFLTLTVELLNFKRNFGFFPRDDDLKRTLETLENKVLLNKNNDPETDKYSRFYKYIFSGTASKNARVQRGQILQDELIKIK